jgi:hypothetical protein
MRFLRRFELVLLLVGTVLIAIYLAVRVDGAVWSRLALMAFQTQGTTTAKNKKTSQTGQTFTATLAQPVSVGGKPALPAGSTASGAVVTAKAKGKIKGQGELDVKLTSISVGGHTYPIETLVLSSTEKGKGKRTAGYHRWGAAGGALIGGVAGGGNGPAIGAAAGAGAGFIGGALTGNKQVEIPAESALSFTLAAPLTLPAPEGQAQ